MRQERELPPPLPQKPRWLGGGTRLKGGRCGSSRGPEPTPAASRRERRALRSGSAFRGGESFTPDAGTCRPRPPSEGRGRG